MLLASLAYWFTICAVLVHVTYAVLVSTATLLCGLAAGSRTVFSAATTLLTNVTSKKPHRLWTGKKKCHGKKKWHSYVTKTSQKPPQKRISKNPTLRKVLCCNDLDGAGNRNLTCKVPSTGGF